MSLLACALAAQAAADTAGTVHFVRSADSSFDSITSSPSPATQAWLRSHIWRMMVFSPYFDERTSWYPQGWVYQDAYAIYAGQSLAAQHPEWILRDGAGNKLFIPFECAGGTCPQYAGDISNPAFRHYWIEQARAHLAHGYRGLFVDDVNLEERVGNGTGAQVTPIGAGGAIGEAAWRSYMADFMAEIRAAFPSAEIVHNALWFAGNHAGISDPSVRREVESANYILLERGVNDSGLTGGNGPWSLNALFAFVDQVHSLGRGVVLDGASGEAQGIEYNLASYFLISDGNDALSAHGQTPSSFWPGLEANLGEATDARHAWGNLMRRDFAGGMVLVNPPGSPAQTVTLPSAMQTGAGESVTSLTLPAASGVVLRGAVPGSAEEPAEASTQTTIEARVIRTAAHARSHAHSRQRKRHGSRRARAASRSLSRTAPRGGLLTRIAGFVRNATKGGVVVSVEVRRHGRWVALKRLSLPVTSAGRFASLLRLHAGARYRASATYTGAHGFRPSWSGYRLITPRAR
ncbi:MAG TPA: putative glycoside hydrolase [Solirubrobacteraceae bacterium]|nr:putative glycoside hydrolase [Solirubrobacteraceae bacterium]